MPPTVIAVFPAASLVNHSCEPNACCHSRRAGSRGPPLEYVLRCTSDVAAGEEVCVSYLAHFANAATKEVGVTGMFEPLCVCVLRFSRAFVRSLCVVCFGCVVFVRVCVVCLCVRVRARCVLYVHIVSVFLRRVCFVCDCVVCCLCLFYCLLFLCPIL